MNPVARWLFVAMTGVPAVLFLIGAVLLRSPHLFFGGFVMALISGVMYAISRGMPQRPKRLIERPGKPRRD